MKVAVADTIGVDVVVTVTVIVAYKPFDRVILIEVDPAMLVGVFVLHPLQVIAATAHVVLGGTF